MSPTITGRSTALWRRRTEVEHLITRDGRLRLWTTLRRVAPSEVYAYWTAGDKLARWWPEPRGFTPSDSEPGRRLAFDLGASSPFGEGQGVVDFERRDEDTLLTVTQGPVAEGAEDKLLESWTRLLERLKGALEQP